MTSLAAFKRALAAAGTFYCDNQLHPEVSGQRKVLKVQANALKFEMADGRIGWTQWPKRGEYSVDGEALHLLTADGSVAFSYRLSEPAVTK